MVCLCFPPHSYLEILTPRDNGIQSRAFGKGSGQEGGAPHMGLLSHERGSEGSLAHSPSVGTSKKLLDANQEGSPHQKLTIMVVLILDFQPPGRGAVHFCCL